MQQYKRGKIPNKEIQWNNIEKFVSICESVKSFLFLFYCCRCICQRTSRGLFNFENWIQIVNLSQVPGSLFTYRTNVLPQDLTQSPNSKIRLWTFPIALKLERHISSIHAFRFQSDTMIIIMILLQMTKFMGPTWGLRGSCRPQMGPMLAQWILLSGRSNLAASRRLITQPWKRVHNVVASSSTPHINRMSLEHIEAETKMAAIFQTTFSNSFSWM